MENEILERSGYDFVAVANELVEELGVNKSNVVVLAKSLEDAFLAGATGDDELYGTPTSGPYAQDTAAMVGSSSWGAINDYMLDAYDAGRFFIENEERQFEESLVANGVSRRSYDIWHRATCSARRGW